MRSLLFRVFVSFWSIIVITIVVAATLGYIYAERTRATLEDFEISDAMLAASAALQANGRDGLSEWLASLADVTAASIFIVDERGQDLHGRELPGPVRVAMRRFGGSFARPPRPRDPANLRPARPFTQLVGPGGEIYTLFVLPKRHGAAGRLPSYGGIGLVIIALLVSGIVSYLLARAISRPIQGVRESTNAVAAGNLDTRVAEPIATRQDDIGQLARDFDRMTAELQRAWQQQTELTANVSHELRSPLARLRVALELATRKTGDLAELAKIDLETQRLDALIGQLLEYSKLDAASSEVRADTDLEELLRSVVADVQYEFKEQELSVSLAADSATTVTARPQALRSAIENVLRNAAQHSPEQGTVSVHLKSEGGRAVVTVQDQGGGIAAEDLQKIFAPFYRGAGKQSGEGTGLGLAIAARAVALDGGTLTASNADDGLRVELKLPT